jgi:hypothetical protein
METTRNKMTHDEKQLFEKIGKYLDTKLYFYGSIQRQDYFPGYSDIDVYIFTDNMETTLLQLQHILSVSPSDFKPFVYNLQSTNEVIYGTKIMYSTDSIHAEIAIYKTIDKSAVLREHEEQFSWYTIYLLILLKLFYYKLGVINRNTFAQLKNFIIRGFSYKRRFFIL